MIIQYEKVIKWRFGKTYQLKAEEIVSEVSNVRESIAGGSAVVGDHGSCSTLALIRVISGDWDDWVIIISVGEYIISKEGRVLGWMIQIGGNVWYGGDRGWIRIIGDRKGSCVDVIDIKMDIACLKGELH